MSFKNDLDKLFNACFTKTQILKSQTDEKPLTFDDLEDEIDRALDPIIKDLDEDATVVEGFVEFPFTERLDADHYKKIPCVLLVGESGRLYIYALRKLLPDLEM